MDERLFVSGKPWGCLPGTEKQMGDVITGVSTVATSLSSAAVSLAGPFLKQASKQVDNTYFNQTRGISSSNSCLVAGIQVQSWEGACLLHAAVLEDL